MMDAKGSTQLYTLEERVYGDLVSRIRALPVAGPEKRRLIDRAMAILCDAEAALETAGNDAVQSDAALARAVRELDDLEREL